MTENSANEFRPITEAEFDALLSGEKGRLPLEQSSFVRSIEVPTTKVPCFRSEQYGVEHLFAIARFGEELLLFDDVEDEFAFGKPDSDGTLRNWGLCGDLIDALRIIQQRVSLTSQ
jgi:hypothetical protein